MQKRINDVASKIKSDENPGRTLNMQELVNSSHLKSRNVQQNARY